MTTDTSDRIVLDAIGLCKAFGGLHAAKDVSLRVTVGQIAAVIGPNGAGKSTVFNMIAGALPPDSGRVRFLGQDVTGWRPERMARAGLARTFQNVRVLPGLHVSENVLVGLTQFARANPLSVLLRLPGFRREQRALEARALELLDLVGLAQDADKTASALPYGRRKVLELAMALATEPELILLDEPAAGLNQTEKSVLAQLLRRINQSGVALLLIEHDVTFVSTLAEHVTVLNFGQVVAAGPPRTVLNDPAVIEAYLGSGHDRAGR